MLAESNPVENLLVISASLRQTGNRAAAEWFEKGLDRYFDNSELKFDDALGLTRGPGVRKYKTVFLYLQRDNYLQEAYKLCDGLNPWRRCLALSDEVKRFRQMLWPRLRNINELPTGFSKLRIALYNAFRTGLKIPESPRQLFKIINGY